MFNDTNTAIVVPVETRVAQGIAAFETKRNSLTELAQKYTGKKVIDINDNKQLKEVAEARKDLKKERCAIENQAKDIRKSIKEVSDKVSAKEKELVGIISPIEDELEAEENRVEQERERIKQEEARKREELIQSRVKQFIDLGCTFDGSRYSIGERSTMHIALVQMSDSAFEEIVSVYKLEALEIEAKRKEEERLKAEAEEAERQRIASEQKKIEEERAELARLRAEQAEREEAARKEQERIRMEQEEKERQLREEAARVAAEKSRIEEQRWRSRLSELKEIRWNGSYAESKLDPDGPVAFSYEELINLSDEDFNKKRDWHNESVEIELAKIEAEQKKREEEAEQRRIAAEKEAEAKRLQEIEAAKEQARKEEAARIDAENKRLEEERQAQEAEAKRQAALAPDKDKLIALADTISKLEVPAVESEAAKKIADDVKALLAKVQNHIHSKVKSL